MQDEIIMNTTLTLTKSLCTLLENGAIESERDDINKTFTSSLTKCLNLQHELFIALEEKGFYKIENTTKEKITKAYNKHQTEMD